MNKPAEPGPPRSPGPAAVRPWYREPWPWVLIAIPLAAVVASAVTLWLAVSRPDRLVVSPGQYEDISSELRAQSPRHSAAAGAGSASDRDDDDN